MQSQAHPHSQYAAVPLPQHPHPPPPPHHPPSYHHHHHHHSFAPHQNGGGAPQQMQSPTVPAQNGMAHFGIPIEAGPMGVVGARHKKDIKRRTKTGCLTCRKRRIKCDEGHPTCRNCHKSKRECLGYDPIFKQQPAGHAAIQPAPAHPSPDTSSTRETASPAPGSYYSYPLPGGGIGGGLSSSFTTPPGHSYSQPLHRPPDQPVSLDPSLAGTGRIPPAMAFDGAMPVLQPTRNANPLTIDELFSINNIPPEFETREASFSLSAAQRDIDDFYHFHFAQGLDRLFETKWYSSRGPDQLRGDATLSDFVSQCIEQFRRPDFPTAASAQSLEARLVWQLASMPRKTSLNSPAHADQLTHDVLLRLDTVVHLLTGRYLPPDRIPPPPSSHQHSNTEYNERHFWHQLATFASARDDNPDARNKSMIDAALNSMRAILGSLENRDVLYSLAIARHFGGRSAEFHPRQPLHRPDDDSNSEIHKLEVARHFVEGEDQKGTTQVIQRICGMAMRSWELQKR